MRPDRLRLEPYAPTLKGRWDAFTRASKTGALIFRRGFMDYHADRFEDASLVAFEGAGCDNLVALLPACRIVGEDGPMWISHAGLTFGGWITDGRMTAEAMLRLFDLLIERLAAEGFGRLRYKAAPTCFQTLPAEEDRYALFRLGAQLVRCDLTFVIDFAHAPAWSKSKRQGLARARAAGVKVHESRDLAGFQAMLQQALSRHAASPTHSLAELELLSARFPEEIRLFCASGADEALAYVLVFDSGATIHTQYMATNEAGRALGALDAIVDHLQRSMYADRRYLSFGISTEGDGRRLNLGLAGQKEMFGARSMICPWYELSLSTAPRS